MYLKKTKRTNWEENDTRCVVQKRNEKKYIYIYIYTTDDDDDDDIYTHTYILNVHEYVVRLLYSLYMVYNHIYVCIFVFV